MEMARRRLAELRHGSAEAGAGYPHTDREYDINDINDISPPRPVVEAAEIIRLQWTADPRPSLVEDSALWSRLLALAYQRHGDGSDSVFWLVQGIRCCGARLVLRDGRLRLEPRPDSERAGPFEHDLGNEEWRTVRKKWLLPHRVAISALLEALAQEAVP